MLLVLAALAAAPPPVVVASVAELDDALDAGAPIVTLRAGTYVLDHPLELHDVVLRGAGEVTIDVSAIVLPDPTPILDCAGGSTPFSPVVPAAALVVSGATTVENIHFVGLNLPLITYIASTASPCAGAARARHRAVIRKCTFTSAPDAFAVYDVSLGNLGACSCESSWEVTLADDDFDGALWGAFIENQYSNAGARVVATLVRNRMAGMITALAVEGTAVGDGGRVTGHATGNVYHDSLIGVALLGGSDTEGPSHGGSHGVVDWRSVGERFEDDVIGLSVQAGRRHTDGRSGPPAPGQVSAGNRAQVWMWAPVFSGNVLHDAEFFGSGTEEPGDASLEDPVGWPANQVSPGVLAGGNLVELMMFARPVFRDGIGKVVFRAHAADACVFEKFPTPILPDPDGDSCPDVSLDELRHPADTPDFGNRVVIAGDAAAFRALHPDLDEYPPASYFGFVWPGR